ncbi:hypothetical protein PANT_22c00239 [Moesziomyces antarcticus T-34]|uniref:EXPERA domain-containing protein n=1 Tax=Pseudozyma antarctica (strain T-34) TaxID=1151754 RepID=M9M763_PSEA3|nr:hypothetical protein PANT_22c00239 [Moesziomyces antarcticus T-34]
MPRVEPDPICASMPPTGSGVDQGPKWVGPARAQFAKKADTGSCLHSDLLQQPVKMEQSRGSMAAVERRKTLTERPMDVLYLSYFGIHLLASLAIDAQLTYPPYSQSVFPAPLRKVLQDYLTTSKDPFLLAAAAQSSAHIWFRVLLASETQPRAEAMSTVANLSDVGVWWWTTAASSTLQCIFSVLYGDDGAGLTSAQIRALLQNYIPFCLIPLLLTFDMMLRIVGLLDTPRPAQPISSKEE